MAIFTGVNPLPHPPTLYDYVCDALLLGGASRQRSLHTGAIATQLHTGAIATQLHTGAMLHNLADARDLTVHDLASARDIILLTQETLRSMTANLYAAH